jgi:hypothetical protein
MNNLSVIDSILKATKKTNRLGLTVGGMAGALAPVGVFSIAHVEGVLSAAPLWTQPMAFLALGGLVFSALSVVTWSERLFRSRVKAIGWTVLCEGLMTVAPDQLAWLSWLCLAYLVAVNAVSNGCNVALDRAESRPARARRVPEREEVSRVRRIRKAA